MIYTGGCDAGLGEGEDGGVGGGVDFGEFGF